MQMHYIWAKSFISYSYVKALIYDQVEILVGGSFFII